MPDIEPRTLHVIDSLSATAQLLILLLIFGRSDGALRSYRLRNIKMSNKLSQETLSTLRKPNSC